MIDDSGQNLVFLFSTPRAGSTLTSAMLSMHPDVFCPNEPWFLLGLASLYEGGNITQSRYEHKNFELALREFLSESEFLHSARCFATASYNQALQREGKRIFVDKTPRYYHIIEFIDRLFPKAKKIWLKRNPLDVALSYRTCFKVSVEDMFDPEFGPLALDLPLGFRSFSSFFRGQPNTFELAYEDLVTRPPEILRQLCDFVNVQYIDGMECYGRDPGALARRRKLSMGDTNLFAHSGAHTKSVERWKRCLDAEEIQTVLNFLGKGPFQRMGYHGTIECLTRMGFSFPSETAVADRLSGFLKSAKSLTWTVRQENAQLWTVLNSRSWRITAPMRRLGDLVYRFRD